MKSHLEKVNKKWIPQNKSGLVRNYEPGVTGKFVFDSWSYLRGSFFFVTWSCAVKATFSWGCLLSSDFSTYLITYAVYLHFFFLGGALVFFACVYVTLAKKQH